MGWVIYLTGTAKAGIVSIRAEPCTLRPARNILPRPKYSEIYIEELTAAARQLDAPPQYESGDHVRCRGESLSMPIYWQGRQWTVTSFGVECRDGLYNFGNHRLWEDEFSSWGGWITHMSEKEWVDLPDFAEALRIARRLEEQARGGRRL
jgi:hypothetical protein